MMRYLILAIVVLLLVGCSAGTQKVVVEDNPSVDMTSSLNKLSYATGYKIGDMFQNQKLSIVPDAVLKGMYDARKNLHPALTKAEMKLILRNPKTFLVGDSDSLSQKTLGEGRDFLSANAQREGVVVSGTGLQYLVVREGQGQTPQATDLVRMNYQGRNLKGHIFDSTYKRGTPAEMTVKDLVPGMSEGLQMMKEGSKWEFYIPSQLAFANRGPMAAQTVIFEVELLEVLPAKQ